MRQQQPLSPELVLIQKALEEVRDFLRQYNGRSREHLGIQFILRALKKSTWKIEIRAVPTAPRAAMLVSEKRWEIHPVEIRRVFTEIQEFLTTVREVSIEV